MTSLSPLVKFASSHLSECLFEMVTALYVIIV